MNNFLEIEMYIFNKKTLLNLYKFKKKKMMRNLINIFLMIMIGLEENVSLNMSPKVFPKSCTVTHKDYAEAR